MNWIEVAQYANIVLGLVLALRLLHLKLHRIYSIFAAFVVFDLLQSVVQVVVHELDSQTLDYRLIWITMRPVAWLLSLWMVYALLAAILRNLPGISRLSRVLFNTVFLSATALSLLTAVPEYSAMEGSHMPPMDQTVVVGLTLDRAISTAAIIVLLVMLAFILWFPVQMPRNLAVFSIGLVTFFGAKSALMPIRAYFPHFFRDHSSLLSTATGLVLMACFVYWILFISSRGEEKNVRLGHSWERAGQIKLIDQLESMNAALLRVGR
jgi:hypothetical protein